MCISAVGSMVSKTVDRRVIEPVCQCSSNLPVDKMNGKSSSGSSAGGRNSAGVNLPKPDFVGNELQILRQNQI